MIGREEEIRDYRQRAQWVNYVVLFALLLIGGRLFYLQVAMGDKLRRYSEANRLKKEKLRAPRGIIYDREGKVIVDNRASFDVVLISQYYEFKKEQNKALAKILGMPLKDLNKRLEKAKNTPVFYPTLLKADVSKDVIAGIEMGGFNGVNIEANVIRRYPYSQMAAQILGYVGEISRSDLKRLREKGLESGDYLGRRGLERRYDEALRGQDGVGYVQVDARGRRRAPDKDSEFLGFIAQTDPNPGKSLHLTLDIDLQSAAEKAMIKGEYQGSVVALDPRSGEVLAMVSLPAYAPSSVSGRQVSSRNWNKLSSDASGPLKNRAIQEHYPPGSTFKLFLALAALNQGMANQHTVHECKGWMRLGRRRFHCWKRHGKVDFFKAIRESCDVYFYNLGLELGVDMIAKFARLFGYGSRTGVHLNGEQPGVVPDVAWKQKFSKEPWQKGETLTVSIGQGDLRVTPLQLAVSFAAIGNQGFVYRPYLVNRIEGDGEILKKYRPELIRRVEIPSEAFRLVKDGLWEVANKKGGTAYWTSSKIVEMSGKTGTAQVKRFKNIMSKKCDKLDPSDRHHGLFVGYAPKENPEIVVSVVGEHVCKSSKAAKVATEVIDTYFKKKEARRVIAEEEGDV